MSGGNSVYSPLPQSNSDSDEFSEEELHSSNERQRGVNHISRLQKPSKPELILNGKKPKITNYKQLDNDRDIGITLNGFQLGTDEITVLKPSNKIEKFSTSRKICFSFSIFLCVFITVVFLWILPCEIGSCPPVVVDSWRKFDLFDIELHGPISIVPNTRDQSHNLVFLYRKSFSSENDKTTRSSERGGVISLLGARKEVSWYVRLEREPKDLDCNVIDVDLDGLSDCIVVGSNNLLKAIQSLSGNELWDIHGENSFDSKPCDLSFPIVLPDLSGDHVSDLLTICSVGMKSNEDHVLRNYFVLISGRTGAVIGKTLEIPHCYSIRTFMLEKENLSYTCLDSASQESLNTVHLRDILVKVDPSLFQKFHINQTEMQRTQHKTISEEYIFTVQGKHLSLENQGRCPDDCNMMVTIKDEKDERNNQPVWVRKSSGSYGMIPVVMKFGALNGFVLKYWQWESDKERATDSSKSKKETSCEWIRRLKEPKYLEKELFSGTLPETPRCKRMLPKRLSNDLNSLEGSVFKGENYTFHKIIERVVLIIFNETDTHTVNASQTEITQICKHLVNCQPNVLFQRHSLLIADLDHDNFHELISYSTSFVNRMEQDSISEDTRWHLQSTVQVIRLEAELPKLYDSRKQ